MKTPTLSQLHHILLQKIIEKGHAPDHVELAQHFQVSESIIKKTLHDLEEYHGLVLHPNEPKVWAIHPFSLAPTHFSVRARKRQWWGNCAWCSLGIAALLKQDVTIISSIGAEGTPLEINIVDGRVQENDLFVHFPIPMKKAWDNVIYTCSNMLVFENVEQVDSWCTRHQIPKGDVQPIQLIWEFSRKWYGNHLNPDWKKWTTAEASQIFMEFGLTHPVWDLNDSNDRF